MTIDEALAQARSTLERVTPAQAEPRLRAGALLVDIRPQSQRERDGGIPGSVVIDRNVLEWRLDPASDARIAAATDHDLDVIVVCQEGYASSLAAASLQRLGLHRATDLVGGFQRWRDDGYPVTVPD